MQLIAAAVLQQAATVQQRNKTDIDHPQINALCAVYARWPDREQVSHQRINIINKFISKLPARRLIITRRVHPEKKGVRVLGIAESFKKFTKKSILAGVVMRRDLIIDGMAYGTSTIEGNDATNSIISIHRSLARDDINCIMLDGLVISMYNIIDGEQVAGETGLPVIAITFEDSKGLEDSIKHHFDDWQDKLIRYQKLGRREQVTLKTGKNLFIRCWRVNQRKAVAILNSFTLQGSIPEPIRVAKLAARSYANALNYELEKN
ncbi:MAG TPA: DUF99 family protein [Nitrososphaera sp.]|nr:DUF99 family protein [Nitrososphaera sp.]